MAGRDGALEVFSANFVCCSKGSWGRSLRFCFWRVLQGIVHLIFCFLGPSLAEVHVLCSGVAQGDTVLEPGHGEHMALAVQEGQSGTGDLGGRFFVVQWELLMNVHSLFGVQELWLPRRLRKWLFGLLAACHTYLELLRPCHSVCAFRAGYCPVLSTPSPMSTLSSPQAQGKLDLLGLFAPRGVQVMSKIHTCLRQVVSVQQKYEFSTSVCSANAKCFCRNLQSERIHFLCRRFHYFNLGGVCFSLSFGVRLIPGLDLEVLLLQGQKTSRMFQRNFSKAVRFVSE